MLSQAPEVSELLTLVPRTADGPRLTSRGPMQPWFWSGMDGEAERAVLFNDSSERCQATITFRSEATILRWDTLSGTSANCGTGPSLEVTLEPMELALFSCGERYRGDKVTAERAWGEARELVGPWLLSIPAGEHAYAGSERSIDTTSGWEKQGLPDFGGSGVYSTSVELDEGGPVLIELPHVAGSASLRANGIACGRRSWAPFSFLVETEALRPGQNLIEITIAGHAANRYYAETGMREEPEPDGLLATPRIRYEQNERKA